MTAREAISRIKEHARIHLEKEPRAVHITEALKMACNALEKQIPKKPLDKTQEYDGEYGLCPNCGKVVSDYKEPKRCSDCAQALDWSDTE